MKYIRYLEVWPGAGRHIEHDDRSRNYPAAQVTPRSVTHQMNAVPVDQGSLGCCTASAAVNLLNCAQFAAERRHASGSNRYLTQRDAAAIYSQATRIDEFPGVWPPSDTGSSGLAVAKVLKALGYVNTYTHAFGVEHLLAAIPIQPVMVGTSWYEGMTDPKKTRIGSHRYWVADPVGEMLGGHEYLCIGANLEKGLLMFVNSWGPNWPDWGADGRFVIPVDVFGSLLADNGDVTVPVGWV